MLLHRFPRCSVREHWLCYCSKFPRSFMFNADPRATRKKQGRCREQHVEAKAKVLQLPVTLARCATLENLLHAVVAQGVALPQQAHACTSLATTMNTCACFTPSRASCVKMCDYSFRKRSHHFQCPPLENAVSKF